MIRYDVIKGGRVISHVSARNMSMEIAKSLVQLGFSVVGTYIVRGP